MSNTPNELDTYHDPSLQKRSYKKLASFISLLQTADCMSVGSLQKIVLQQLSSTSAYGTYDWFVPGVQNGPLGERYIAYAPTPEKFNILAVPLKLLKHYLRRCHKQIHHLRPIDSLVES